MSWGTLPRYCHGKWAMTLWYILLSNRIRAVWDPRISYQSELISSDILPFDLMERGQQLTCTAYLHPLQNQAKFRLLDPLISHRKRKKEKRKYKKYKNKLTHSHFKQFQTSQRWSGASMARWGIFLHYWQWARPACLLGTHQHPGITVHKKWLRQ